MRTSFALALSTVLPLALPIVASAQSDGTNIYETSPSFPGAYPASPQVSNPPPVYQVPPTYYAAPFYGYGAVPPVVVYEGLDRNARLDQSARSQRRDAFHGDDGMRGSPCTTGDRTCR